MATLKTIRKRISSVRNTQQITKAMKMVSAAKLRRAQDAAVQARPYAEKMTELLKNVAARVSSEAHPLLQAREEKKIQLVLFTSDRGLCGGYNANLIRAAEAFIRQNAGEKEVELTLVGRKGADHFRRRRANIVDRYIGILAPPADELAAEIGAETHRAFHQRRDRRGLYSLQPVSLGAVAGADLGKASAGSIEPKPAMPRRSSIPNIYTSPESSNFWRVCCRGLPTWRCSGRCSKRRQASTARA